LPSIQSPLGALPARFRRERLLIVGCGDVGLRVASAVKRRVQVLALTSSPERCALLREHGVTPLIGDLDRPASLARLAGLATRVVHLAPPRATEQPLWWRDFRTQALLRTIRLRSPPLSLVYGSTSGVYGDCAGDLVGETRAVNPGTPRAHRRVDAERSIRHFGRVTSVRSSVLRIPGIYAADRAGGPRERLLRGLPVLDQAQDVYTSHIQADDLAGIILAALWRGRPQRIYNVSDDTRLKMGDYFDLAADLYGLPRPRRISRAAAGAELSAASLSFMGESRRLENGRMKLELRSWLHHSDVQTGLRAPIKAK
jgi:nucleoside-diphosphate-sugar epimerase